MAARDLAMTEEESSDQTGSDNHLEGCLRSGTLCRILPFHLIIDRRLNVVQCGNSIAKRIRSNGGQRSRLTDMFRILDPLDSPPLTFDQLLATNEGNVVLEVIPEFTRNTKHSEAGENSTSSGEGESNLILDGRVIHLEEPDTLLFHCTPRISTINELARTGLTLTDIPGHVPTRDIIIWNELLRRERRETGELEKQAVELQRQLEELELEKGLSDRLLYSILPAPVADQLRRGASVEGARFDCVSILFSGICEFGGFCLNCQPIDVVHLLNDLYSQFDFLAEQPDRKVYKVETVGDKYMLVSGLPERNADHAVSIALTALDMLDIGRRTKVNGCAIHLTVGVHSGEAVGGVVGQRMPHYAVFGSAVCQASRMESTGMADQVNISEATYRLLQKHRSVEDLVFEERGLLTMKGINEPIMCYLLQRHRLQSPVDDPSGDPIATRSTNYGNDTIIRDNTM